MATLVVCAACRSITIWLDAKDLYTQTVKKLDGVPKERQMLKMNVHGCCFCAQHQQARRGAVVLLEEGRNRTTPVARHLHRDLDAKQQVINCTYAM